MKPFLLCLKSKSYLHPRKAEPNAGIITRRQVEPVWRSWTSELELDHIPPLWSIGGSHMTFPTRPHKNTLKGSVWSLLRPEGLNMTGELFPEAVARWQGREENLQPWYEDGISGDDQKAGKFESSLVLVSRKSSTLVSDGQEGDEWLWLCSLLAIPPGKSQYSQRAPYVYLPKINFSKYLKSASGGEEAQELAPGDASVRSFLTMRQPSPTCE